MGIIRKSIDYFIKRISSSIKQANNIHVLNRGFIHKNCIITSAFIRGDVVINEGCKIIGGVKINAKAPVVVNKFTSINGPGTEIHSNLNPVKIGSFCSIARNVSIQEFNHRYDRVSSYFISQNIFGDSVKKDIDSKGEIVIGNDVWIGANVSILSGVKIGNGAVIAANSVVSSNVPDYAIVGGVPAKKIKMRFPPDIIDKLLKIKWWEWHLEKIKRNRSFFEGSLTTEKLSNIS